LTARKNEFGLTSHPLARARALHVCTQSAKLPPQARKSAFADRYSTRRNVPEEIRSYQLFLLNEKRVKLSTYIQAISGLRFFFQNTLHRRIDIDRIPLPRYEKKLPAILSKPEVKALLEAPRSLKQRAMLATMYAAGLRVSEVANLKVSDLDRDRRVIWVRGGKGRKDRQVMLSEALREVLVAYWLRQRPTDWLFPGRKQDCPITSDSIFKACVAAAKKAGINKTVHPHSLRHALPSARHATTLAPVCNKASRPFGVPLGVGRTEE